MEMMKNAMYDKKEWSARISKIKTFAKYGLIEYSDHALNQMQSRNIEKKDLEKALAGYNSSIVQCHAKGTYNDNEDELVVILGKIKKDNFTQPLHIILAEHVSDEGGVHYKVVTTYVPSPIYFHANGRIIR